MSGMFDDFKEQVRSQANIVEIISEYVPLKKRGGSFWGCCPFHGEKTPSFSVTPDKNFFYCYGCHVGGDVFTFVKLKLRSISQDAALHLRLSSGFQLGWHCRTITHCFQHLENVDVVLDCWCRPGWR